MCTYVRALALLPLSSPHPRPGERERGGQTVGLRAGPTAGRMEEQGRGAPVKCRGGRERERENGLASPPPPPPPSEEEEEEEE